MSGIEIRIDTIACASCKQKNGSFRVLSEYFSPRGCDLEGSTHNEPLSNSLAGGSILSIDFKNRKKWSLCEGRLTSLELLLALSRNTAWANQTWDPLYNEHERTLPLAVFVCDTCIAQGKDFYMPKIIASAGEYVQKVIYNLTNRTARAKKEYEKTLKQINQERQRTTQALRQISRY